MQVAAALGPAPQGGCAGYAPPGTAGEVRPGVRTTPASAEPFPFKLLRRTNLGNDCIAIASAGIGAYALTGRLTGLWSSAWLGKGFFALLDQGLIGSSNFLMGILLARRLLPQAYGTYALAFEIFLGLSVVYAALILEPMSVLGPSVYRNCLGEYLGVLLRIHLWLALATIVTLGSLAWLAHELARSSSLPRALAGVTLAGPCLLLFWLARRAFYVKLLPREAVSGAVLYCVVLLGGLLIAYRLLSPFVAFLLMAVGALITGSLLVMRLKPSLRPRPAYPSLLEVVQRHWAYGRWALASSLVMWSAGAIYYPLLGSFKGLADTGSLKALLNLSSPVGQAFIAFSLLALPYAARIHHQEGAAGAKRLAWRFTSLYAGGTAAYWALIVPLRVPILRFLYAGGYTSVSSLVPWVALGSVLRIASTAQAGILRAMQSPYRVFVAYSASGAVGILTAVPAIWALGLRGAIFALVVSNGTALVVAHGLLRRSLRRASEVST